MKLMEMLDPTSDIIQTLQRKLAPPLVTLLSTESEIQYVALRNINLIVQKRYSLISFHLISLNSIYLKARNT
jgi:AP-1 complex subunit beta-1